MATTHHNTIRYALIGILFLLTIGFVAATGEIDFNFENDYTFTVNQSYVFTNESADIVPGEGFVANDPYSLIVSLLKSDDTDVFYSVVEENGFGTTTLGSPYVRLGPELDDATLNAASSLFLPEDSLTFTFSETGEYTFTIKLNDTAQIINSKEVTITVTEEVIIGDEAYQAFKTIEDVLEATSIDVSTVQTELSSGRYTALLNDLESNFEGQTLAEFEELANELISFRLAVQEAVDSAKDGSFTIAHLESVNETLHELKGKTVNGEEVTVANLSVGEAFIEQMSALSSGRQTAIANDLKTNADTYNSFTELAELLHKLVAFRTATQTAVFNTNEKAFAIEDLENVQAALTELEDLTINTNVDVNANFLIESQEGIDRLKDLEPGRLSALKADLEANADYTSFTHMSITLHELLEFREALEKAVINANTGNLTVDNLQAVADTMALLEGKTVNDEILTEELITQAEQAVIAVENLEEGRFAALITDLESNNPYVSFTQVADALELLAVFRINLQETIETAEAGNFNIANLTAVKNSLETLKHAGLKVNGYVPNEDAISHFVEKIADLESLATGRFAALQADLASNEPYASFTEFGAHLEKQLAFRLAVQEAVNAAKNGEFTVANLESVNETLHDLEGKMVNGLEVDSELLDQGEAFIDRMHALATGRQAAIAADLESNSGEYNSFTELADILHKLVDFREATQKAVDTTNDEEFSSQLLLDVHEELKKLVGLTINDEEILDETIFEAQMYSTYVSLVEDRPRIDEVTTQLYAEEYNSFTELADSLWNILVDLLDPQVILSETFGELSSGQLTAGGIISRSLASIQEVSNPTGVEGLVNTIGYYEIIAESTSLMPGINPPSEFERPPMAEEVSAQAEAAEPSIIVEYNVTGLEEYIQDSLAIVVYDKEIGEWIECTSSITEGNLVCEQDAYEWFEYWAITGELQPAPPPQTSGGGGGSVAGQINTGYWSGETQEEESEEEASQEETQQTPSDESETSEVTLPEEEEEASQQEQTDTQDTQQDQQAGAQGNFLTGAAIGALQENPGWSILAVIALVMAIAGVSLLARKP